MERKLFADELEAKLDELLFASPSHRSISRLAETVETLPRVRQDRVLHWAGVVALTSAELGHLVCMLAPQAFAFLDEDGFDAWVLAALDTYDKQGARPAMEQLRDLEGLRAAHEGRCGVRFADVEPRLSPFVRGLSGRPLGLREGAQGWTDTETVFLPGRLARLATADGNRRLYKAMAVLLWAQARWGTFNADLEEVLEGHADRERALAWLNVFEAMRLESCIARELPGLAREIAALRGPWPEDLAAVVAELGAEEATVAVSLRRLLEFGDDLPPAPAFAHLGTLDPAAASRTRAARVVRETAIVRRALNVLRGAGGARQQDPASSLPAEAQVQSIELSGDMIAQLPPDARAAAGSLIQDLGEIPPETLAPAGEGSWSPLPDGAAPDGVEARSGREPDRRYDEWDCRRQAYRRGWCHLYESEVTAGEQGYVAEVRARHAPLIRQIRRRFEILRGEDRIHRRQPEGGEIDLDALVEARADRRGGAEPSSRLFCRRSRTDRSLAAMFMVDMSGSTKGWINDAEREALVMLCEALESLGDDYAIYGFSGWTRTRCDIYRVKRFGEPYGEEVRGRIAGIEAKDYTRMGVAVRHLSGLLARQPVRHKLLVTLSDGRPDDFGDEYRGTYGIEDTRRALQEARQAGIRSYCVTIDRHGADYLGRLYGPAHYAVLDDVKKLPLRIAEIYRKLAT